MSSNCKTIIGGPVILSISGGNLITGVGAAEATVPTTRDIKFETEGSLTISPRNFMIESRSEGRGHTKRRRNSVIEGTITASNGLFDDILNTDAGADELEPFGGAGDTTGGSGRANNLRQMFELCDMTINLILDCGDVWTMRNALYEGEESLDLREGTATFRFTSPSAMTLQREVLA